MLARFTVPRALVTASVRPTTSSSRPLHGSSLRRQDVHPSSPASTGAVGNSGNLQSTAEAKNAAWPAFIAIGVASVVYLAYSNVSERKKDNQANKEAPHDEQTNKRPLGETSKTSSRG
ncbi:hypothetical protein JCM10212_002384 [Sporobolomyces blumeae]